LSPRPAYARDEGLHGLPPQRFSARGRGAGVPAWRRDDRCRVAVVGDSASETNQDIAEVWQALGLDAAVLSPAESLESLRPGDTALGRVDVRRSLDGIAAGLLELLALQRRGVRVLNRPGALLRAHDKLRTARALAAALVPHPPTEHITRQDPRPSLLPPVVVKPRFGSWGAEVIRCDSAGAVRAAIEALHERPWFQRQGALVQSLVPPIGHDLRVLVAGGSIVGAESRIAAEHEWRTNISLGGSSCAAIVPPSASGRLRRDRGQRRCRLRTPLLAPRSQRVHRHRRRARSHHSAAGSRYGYGPRGDRRRDPMTFTLAVPSSAYRRGSSTATLSGAAAGEEPTGSRGRKGPRP